MGYYLLHSLGGVPYNTSEVADYFTKALSAHPDAGFYLGELAMGAGESSSAVMAYTSSVALGHVLSSHRLGHMAAKGTVSVSSVS